MKPTRFPQQGRQKTDKKLLKSLIASTKRLHQQERNNPRLRIVRSVIAGHVRGGHSFH